jgi:hypothetical protein
MGFGFAAVRDGFAVAATRAGFAFDFARALVFARAALARVEGAAFASPAAVAAALEPVPRLALRRPGRDLGRLPSTPCSSLLSAATREK